MANRDEVVSPPADDATPLPITVGDMTLPRAEPSPPTPAEVLRWIAAAGGPWFASRHAAATGTDRDALDDPLAHLRLAGLVRIATWERGLGQGYLLTPAGEEALATGAGIPDAAGKFAEPLPSGEVPVPQGVPDSPGTDYRPPPPLGLDPRPPLVVPALLILNVLWFFVGLVAASRAGIPIGKFLANGRLDVLHKIGGVAGPDLLAGEWWRLLTSCFVHGNGLHILMNLIALAVIGPLAELLWGRGRLAVIYVFSGLGGTCLAMALHPDALLVGASGAIWGVLMATLAWFLMFRDRLPPAVASDSLRRLGLAVVLNAAFSFAPGISWEGHLGGAVVGFAAAGLLNTIRFADRTGRRITLGLLLLLPVVCVAGLIGMMRWGQPWAEFRRLAAEDRTRRAAAEAQDAFNRDVVPLLEKISPEAVRPAEAAAVGQLVRPGGRRNPATVAAVRAKLAELREAADAAARMLDVPAVGVDYIDRHRLRARAYAEARSHSLALLLVMLDSPATPDPATWSAWGTARRAADALWPGGGRQ